MAGLISFPIEIIFVITYFTIIEIKNIKNDKGSINLKKLYVYGIKKVKGKKVLKTFGFLILPWMILLLGNMMFFSYFFDDPMANYLTIEKTKNYDHTVDTLIEFESKDFENIKQYSKYLLPYQIPGTYNKIDSNLDEHFGENWPGLVGLSFLFFITFVSIKTKDHRFHIILFMIFIISYVWFYSAITWEERSEGKEIPARYMIPAFVLSSFMIGFITEKILKFTVKRKKLKVSLTIIKSLIIFGLILFFIIGFYFHPSIQNVGGDFKNHENYSERYPLDFEGIEPNSIILSHNSIRVLEYNGLISFDVMPLHENGVQKNSVELLKQLNDEGYDIFTFKKSFNYMGLEIKKTLIEEYNIILKNHSKTFCKVEFQISDNLKSDKECLDNEPIRIPYFMK
jgi:hypothetical protein